MTGPVLVIVLGCAVLLVIGGLIGHSLSQHLLEQQIRRQAALQRQIGEQWRDLVEDRQLRSQGLCPQCGEADRTPWAGHHDPLA